jgi:catechol 2,3-dioxygenase-like lactoylglutathione lyase family enzyme
MIDHIILTVSNVERSLAFYEAALAPLDIKFFMPYKGNNGHPDLWGFGNGSRAFFWLKHGAPDPQNIHWDSRPTTIRQSTHFTRQQLPPARGTIFHRARGWNTIPATTRPMSLTRMDIHSRSSTRANERVPAVYLFSRAKQSRTWKLAQRRGMAICPKVGGFPYLAEALRRLGVTRK